MEGSAGYLFKISLLIAPVKPEPRQGQSELIILYKNNKDVFASEKRMHLFRYIRNIIDNNKSPSSILAERGNIHTNAAIPTLNRLPLAKKLPRKLKADDPRYTQALEESIWKKGFEKLNRQ